MLGKRTASGMMKRRKPFRRQKRWRKKYIRRYGKTKFARAVRSVIMKTAEKKFRTSLVVFNTPTVAGATPGDISHQIFNSSVIAGSIFNNVAEDGTGVRQLHPELGASDGGRNGDEIWGTGIMLRGTIQVPYDRRNSTFKIWMVEYNTTQGNLWGTSNNAWPASGTSPISGQAQNIMNDFMYTSAVENPIIGLPRQDNWKPRLIGTYRLKSRDLLSTAGDNTESTIYFRKWIPFRRKLCFKDESTTFTRGMKERVHLLIGADDLLTTPTNTVIGRVQVLATFYYKDP